MRRPDEGSRGVWGQESIQVKGYVREAESRAPVLWAVQVREWHGVDHLAKEGGTRAVRVEQYKQEISARRGRVVESEGGDVDGPTALLGCAGHPAEAGTARSGEGDGGVAEYPAGWKWAEGKVEGGEGREVKRGKGANSSVSRRRLVEIESEVEAVIGDGRGSGEVHARFADIRLYILPGLFPSVCCATRAALPRPSQERAGRQRAVCIAGSVAHERCMRRTAPFASAQSDVVHRERKREMGGVGGECGPRDACGGKGRWPGHCSEVKMHR
ncbi:hypothetical protein K438DRAFT_1764430 [Mycena galopus ATCC 62051]|nr:hypothetical protein K438DRAFT_1764430 [Mycena galopus ATCC 62051]